MPQTLLKPVYAELEVKKSRFLTWVEPIENAQQAKQRLEQVRNQYPDARHVCFAFYVDGSSGMSDDGEPSGTAGKPMFSVLNHKHLENVIAIIVRYFGGVKLGAGGLTRAYSGAVSKALDDAEFITIETQVLVKLRFPFALESNARRICENLKITMANVSYSDNVQAELIVPESRIVEVEDAILALAPGSPDLVFAPEG
jgi:uncharacterized YigZ family protein